MRLLVIFAIIGISQGLFAQQSGLTYQHKHEAPLTCYDSVMLSSLPELNWVSVLKSSELPSFIDNSELPYFRPIYQQIHSECGQVSGIAYNFTYEINRLRDLPADTPATWYPTHFTYNFMNGGYGLHGVSYFHSFEILRTLGCPTVETYGGMAAGGYSRWMSGYDDYYSAMKNRIRQAYQIRVGTPEGLQVLKQWLHNHLEGDTIGGVASFYSNSPWNLKTLPEGTPDGGKHVIAIWGGPPTHSMTIVGYNDSIRYDYNGDSIYTNNLDINEDGLIDMRDWEIGGLLFADGWGSGINFADSGKCYMMYKTLAEKVYDGGIWNNAVHVLDVKDLEKPLLTAKVSIEHPMRSFIRVRCGISANIKDSFPTNTLEFPVFNFQGAAQYMQGGDSIEENKTIEFGLDITPLLSYIDDSPMAKIFLEVEERDANNLADGKILSFSVIDYSGINPLTYTGDTLVPINNNTTTYTSISRVPLHTNLAINTDFLPPAVINQAYSHQLTYQGGTAPYTWYLLNAYSETEITGQEIDSSGTLVEPTNWDYGNVAYALPFSFQFYEQAYDTIYIHPDGFIMFKETTNPWPYMSDGELFIRRTACIAPFACQKLKFTPASGHGIWVSEADTQISIRWIGKVNNSYYSPTVEFALTLCEDGEISFVYGSDMDAQRINWCCGFSEGNTRQYHFPEIVNKQSIVSGQGVKMGILPQPAGLQLSEDGVYAGTPTQYLQQIPLSFCVKDDNNILAFKDIEFSSSNLSIEEKWDTKKSIIDEVYPNPFRSKLNIRFSGHGIQKLSCHVYSSSGILITTLLEDSDLQHLKSIQWDARDTGGNNCPAGIYLVVCTHGNLKEVKKVIYYGP